jgi:aerotaxis receptor
VKNRCKNGDHYWVNAYVTPVFRGGEVVAYQSVRTKPKREWVTRAERLYADINRGKAKLKLNPLSTPQRYMLSGLGVLLAVAVLALVAGANSAILLPGMFMMALIAGWQFYRLGQPLQKLTDEARSFFDNGIAPHVYGDRADDVGVVQCAFAALQARITTLVTRLGDTSEALSHAGHATSEIAGCTSEGLEQQRREMEQASISVKEMVTTIADVAQNTQRTADATQQASIKAKCGGRQVEEVAQSTLVLTSRMAAVAETIGALNSSSENIGGLLAVIQNIAEQTNLLALNAAIEAARAGEQGRGFAVVADEVRSLATRTQGSTQEIESMIRALRGNAHASVQIIETAHTETEKIAEQAHQAAQEFNGIESAINTIADMSIQIASATEQQTVAANDISRTIDAVHDLTERCSAAAKRSYETSHTLNLLTDEMKNTVEQFGR